MHDGPEGDNPDAAHGVFRGADVAFWGRNPIKAILGDEMNAAPARPQFDVAQRSARSQTAGAFGAAG